MEQQPNGCRSISNSPRSPALALLGALALGLILVLVFLALLTVPSRALAGFHDGPDLSQRAKYLPSSSNGQVLGRNMTSLAGASIRIGNGTMVHMLVPIF